MANMLHYQVQFAGSHFDRLRIKKPDEFDMDIVIGLPLNINCNQYSPGDSDIVLEAIAPGFVQLRMGVQYQRLPVRDGTEWQVNRSAYGWKDERDYLLRSKFIDWFKSVVIRGLNSFKVQGQFSFDVDGVPYAVTTSGSGPAVTLIVQNRARGFKLDVDLVPALKFPEDRWPPSRSYRAIPPRCSRGWWMVVPKPNSAGQNQHDKERSWRIALHDQERVLMHDSYNLRQAVRLLKKLRDEQGMKKIASYYIKTLFYLEVVARDDPSFWRKDVATLFTVMVRRLHEAVQQAKISYFWNKHQNLIGNIDSGTLRNYADKLAKLIAVLDRPQDYKMVAKFLLSPVEFNDYNRRFLHI